MADVQHGIPAMPRLPPHGRVLADLGELEVAHEELRVAEEELARQKEQIEQLIAQHDSGRRCRDHLFALLPVGVLVTDPDGVVQEANPAAAAMFGVRPVHLPGKPLAVYVDVAQRRSVRDLLARARQGAAELQAQVVLRPRRGQPVEVDLVGLRETESSSPLLLRWLLLPRGEVPGPAELPPQDGEDAEDDSYLRTAAALAQLCTLPVDVEDQQRLLTRIALTVRSAVPGASAVSISIGNPVVPDRLASDSLGAQTFDGLQLRTGEGPCVDAYQQQIVVTTDDVTRDARWPRLASAARGQSLRAILALPIRVADERTGILNLYAARPGAFEGRTARVGEIVASAVAAVLRGVSERASLQALSHHLERALSSRAVIEQAKGIVMAHHGGTPNEAFARLVALSSRANVKLRDLAELIVRQRETDTLGDL